MSSANSLDASDWTFDYTRSEWFAWILGLFFSAMTFGGICTLCILNFSLLQKRAKQEKSKEGRISATTTCMFLYIFWMCILCSGVLAVALESTLPHPTVSVQANLKAFQNILSGLPQSIVGVACFSLVHWAFEVLLIWRCYVIYRNSIETVWLLLSFAGFVFLASVASGALFLVTVIMKKSTILKLLLLIHGGICLLSNLILTHLIVVRLYLYRRHIIKLVGRQYAGHYTSILSIIIESGIVMNLVLVSVVVSVVKDTQWLSFPLLTFPLIEALSSFVIVYRVAVGSAWSSGTANDLIAQHAMSSSSGRGGRQPTSLHPSERLSAMRYRVTSQGTQASTAFRFNHHTMSSNMSQILESLSQRDQMDSRENSIRIPESCRRGVADDDDDEEEG